MPVPKDHVVRWKYVNTTFLVFTDDKYRDHFYLRAVSQNVEIHIDGNLFSLHINPYFLRLHLPKRVQEDDASSAQYDPSTGYLTVILYKEVPGEYFEDLDLLAKLLVPRPKQKESDPIIEVIGGSEDVGQLDRGIEMSDIKSEHELFLEAAKNDWRLPQSLPNDDDPQLATTLQRTYGFLDKHSGYFHHVGHVENEVHELGVDAEILAEDERRRRGEERVDSKFDEDYYLADFVNDDDIQGLIRWQHPYSPESPQQQEFSEDEKLTMLRLPRKEYLPTDLQTSSLYMTLVAILFSAAYETRTTLADPTSESAWTISVLTPAFASLSMPRVTVSQRHPSHDGPSSALLGVFVSSYRRALSFPLYRSFVLCERCRLDVADILGGGRRTVLRSLLNIKSVLDKHDVYYVYSKIWIDDYCVWIQSLANEQTLRSLSAEVRSAEIQKRDLGLNLEELENLARLAAQRTPDSDDEEGDA